MNYVCLAEGKLTHIWSLRSFDRLQIATDSNSLKWTCPTNGTLPTSSKTCSCGGATLFIIVFFNYPYLVTVARKPTPFVRMNGTHMSPVMPSNLQRPDLAYTETPAGSPNKIRMRCENP